MGRFMGGNCTNLVGVWEVNENEQFATCYACATHPMTQGSWNWLCVHLLRANLAICGTILFNWSLLEPRLAKVGLFVFLPSFSPSPSLFPW